MFHDHNAHVRLLSVNKIAVQLLDTVPPASNKNGDVA
jgi:hypothetical protein